MTASLRSASSPARVGALVDAIDAQDAPRWNRRAIETRLAYLETVVRSSDMLAGALEAEGKRAEAGAERWRTMLERQERRLLVTMLDAVIGAEFDDALLA